MSTNHIDGPEMLELAAAELDAVAVQDVDMHGRLTIIAQVGALCVDIPLRTTGTEP